MKRITLDEIYEDFIRPKTAKNLTPETIEHYRRAYRIMSRFMHEQGKKHFTKLTQDDWLNLMCWLNNGKRNAVTINTYLRGIKSLVFFSKKKYGFPHIEPELLKTPYSYKAIYTTQQILALINEPSADSEFREVEGWTLSCLLLYCCLRAKSLCKLTLNDFDFHDHEFTVKKLKSGRVETFPMTEYIERVFLRYIEARKKYQTEKRLKENGLFFINTKGGAFDRNSLFRMDAAYNKSRGVDKTGLHVFRNTFAKIMIQNGADAFTLQKWMTHNNIKSTKVYVDLFAKDLLATVYKYNPLESIRKKSTN